MELKTCFIGHRTIFFNNKEKRLSDAIQQEIKKGCKIFTMGTHGEFDKLSLCICKNLKQIYPEIKIEVVLTSLNQIKSIKNTDNDIETKPNYHDVETIMYDIEEKHFKSKITISNRNMVDECSTLICYVNPKKTRSGAKNTMKYAEKKGLTIINLFQTEDYS